MDAFRILAALLIGAAVRDATALAQAPALPSAQLAATEPAATPLPPIDPDCLPIRPAILAEGDGHRGVIVEVLDARPRLAELSRPPPTSPPRRP